MFKHTSADSIVSACFQEQMLISRNPPQTLGSGLAGFIFLRHPAPTSTGIWNGDQSDAVGVSKQGE